MTRKKKYIKLTFPKPIVDYDFIELISERKDWDESNPYIVLWLDIECVRKLTLLGEQKWPTYPICWTKDKSEYFIKAWDPHKKNTIETLAYIPRISMNYFDTNIKQNISWIDTLKNYFFGRVKDDEKHICKPVIIFGNGRHRAEFFRINGVKCMPFETRKSYAEDLLLLCGGDDFKE